MGYRKACQRARHLLGRGSVAVFAVTEASNSVGCVVESPVIAHVGNLGVGSQGGLAILVDEPYHAPRGLEVTCIPIENFGSIRLFTVLSRLYAVRIAIEESRGLLVEFCCQTIAGVDMSQMKPDDVQITENGNRSIKLTLPASQVFVTSIDNAHTRVYSRDTGIFVSADPNLESLTRAKAQEQLQQAALTDGILDAASKNAHATVTAMLEGLGFEHVEVK